EARPEGARFDRGVRRRRPRLARARGPVRRRVGGRRRARRAQARRRARGRRRGLRPRRRRVEVPLRRVLAGGRRRARDGGERLVVIPPRIRAELVEHAQVESPNEACGLIVLRGGHAERYVRGPNTLASPYRFQLELDDVEAWFLEDEGYELA